jgi:predicted permease
MTIFYRILLKLSRRRRFERDMEAELAFHRDLAQERGNPIGLGNVTRIQEEARDLWQFTLTEDFCRDVAYSVRSLFRTPGFAAIAILTLAVGIGANTAIFTLIYRTMLAPLPVKEPSQLIEVLSDRGGPPGISFSYQALQSFRAQQQVCSSVVGFANVVVHTLIEGFPIDRLAGQFVTGDYFSALGVSTVMGRPIVPADDATGAGAAVAVISHSIWQSRFGGRSEAIGKTIVVENVPLTIVGIAPGDFSGLEVGRRIDFWMPLETERRIRRPSSTSSASNKWLQIVGRLKPGSTPEQAQSELRVLYKGSIESEISEVLADPRFNAASDAELPKRMRSWSVVVEPAGTGLSRTREQYSTSLFVLMAIVGVLLLIACTNVANLLFARALGREKEIAVKLSLGAGRSRLVRQLLTESGVLVTAGGVLALLTAYALTKNLTAFLASTNPPLVVDVSPNAATLGFTAAVSVFTALLFGLMPAFQTTDLDFATTLKGTAQGVPGRKSLGWSRGLVVAEVALLLVLVFGAGLFLRTLHNLNSIDVGFDRNNVLLVTVDPFGSGHSQEQIKQLSAELLERIDSLPGVTAASLTRFAPITGGAGVNLNFFVDRDGPGSLEPVLARYVWVNNIGPRYFRALSTPMIAGREFTREDSTNPARLVIVDQTFAERYFGYESPLGKVITQRDVPMEIIGVVQNNKYADIRQGMEPTVYQNVFQQFGVPVQFVIRTERNPATIATAVRTEFRSAMGNVLLRETTLAERVDASIVRERLVTTLASVFGGLALLLAVIGLYGVVSNSVARRTKEIGIRMALGFRRRSAVSMVLREVFVLVGGGIIIGLPLAIFVARAIARQLYGVTPDDPLTVVVSVGGLLLSAIIAGFVPAWRASRVDPIVAIRME